jgi:hypothetical protein
LVHRNKRLDYFFSRSIVLNNDVYIGKLKTLFSKFKEQVTLKLVYDKIEENQKWIAENLKEVQDWLDAKLVELGT